MISLPYQHATPVIHLPPATLSDASPQAQSMQVWILGENKKGSQTITSTIVSFVSGLVLETSTPTLFPPEVLPSALPNESLEAKTRPHSSRLTRLVKSITGRGSSQVVSAIQCLPGAHRLLSQVCATDDPFLALVLSEKSKDDAVIHRPLCISGKNGEGLQRLRWDIEQRVDCFWSEHASRIAVLTSEPGDHSKLSIILYDF
ncbi:hypothetical protein DL93DRAFT_2078033 [Clavulina sp. PMI_390]|nr:hypothetical protein DL93DRAFT_2078033 [Clavulina sp. PMI_390]